MHRRRREREEVFQRIVDLGKVVREKNINPFEIDVISLFDKLRPLLETLKDMKECYLDIEAISEISNVILQQGDWIKNKSSLLLL